MKASRRLLPLLLTVTLLATSAACSRQTAATPPEETPIAVTATTIKPTDLYSTVHFTGRIAAENSVMVFAKASGKVAKVQVKVGDVVQAGDVLYTFDTTDLNNQVSTASAAVRTASAGRQTALTQVGSQVELAAVQLSTAEKAYEGTKALFEAGTASQMDYDRAKAAYDSALTSYNAAVAAQGNTERQSAAQLEQAQAAAHAASTALSYATVTAPIAGTVSMVNVKAFEMASPSAPGVVLTGGDGLQCEFGVTGAYLGKLALGDTVQVEDAYAAEIYELPELPGSNGLYTVKARLTEAADLRTGVSVSVTITTDKKAGVIAVPLDCLRNDRDGAYVYTTDGKVAVKTQVQTGTMAGDYMEVLAGLKEGDVLVTSWSPLMAPGEPLLIVPEEGAA